MGGLLTPKQHRYADGRVAGLPQRQAAIQAGYSSKSSTKSVENKVLPAIALRMEKAGLGDAFLLQKLQDGINGPASAIQARYLEMALRARGAFDHDKQVSQEERHLSFLAQLMGHLADTSQSGDVDTEVDGQCAPLIESTDITSGGARSEEQSAPVDQDGG